MQRHHFRVLLVEENDNDYIVTRDLLAQMRVRVDLTRVTDYYDGLEAMSHSDYDVHVVDYHLGADSGLDLVREAIGAGCKTPIILLTEQNDHEVDIEALRIGAADYLVKGQTGPQLLERSIRYAVERAQMVAALRELAIRDELTSLLSPREMNRLLSEEVDRSLRYTSPMTVIMLDIDHLKAVNDAHGYQAGDAVLQSVAQVVRDSVRTTDRTARYAGEEIAIILPETTPQAALVVAERIRTAVAAKNITVAGANRQPVSVNVTASLGIAGLPDDAISESGLLAAASQAMYEAKRLGCDCTVPFKVLREAEPIAG